MSSTLYRKYRPQGWSDVAGQDHVKGTLAYQVGSGKAAHAYLFSGPRGVGKTTLARIFAKAINCTGRKDGDGEPCNDCEPCSAVGGGSLDIIEIDAASHTGVDNVRENIIDNARFSPSRLKNKVFIIDEVHMLSNAAFNALLKTLEEPPPNVVFLLATTELHKVPATVVSRCQRFDFRKIPHEEVVSRLKRLAESEGFKVEDRVFGEIARHSEGCLRDAEGLLGKVLAVRSGKKVSWKDALTVLPRSDWDSAANFVDAVLDGDVKAALDTVGSCLESGADLDQFAGEVVGALRSGLLARVGGSVDSTLDEKQRERVAGWSRVEAPRLVRAIEVMGEKRQELKVSHPPQLPLELAAVTLCEVVSERVAPVSQPVILAKAGIHDTAKPADTKQKAAATKADVPASKPNAPTESSRKPEGLSGTQKSKKDDNDDKPNGQPPVDVSEKPKQKSPPEKQPAAAQAVADSPKSKEGPAEEPAEPIATVEKLRQMWADLVRRCGEEKHSLSFLLGAGEVVEVCGRTVRVGFQYAFHCEKLNEEKSRTVLERVLGEALGGETRVEGVTLEKNSDTCNNDAAEEKGVESSESGPSGGVQQLAEAFGGRVVG